MCIFMMIATSWSARHHGYKPDHEKPSSPSVIFKACIDSIWALLFPILLIVFIRFGVMTPSESGAFAVFYALFVGVFIYKELNLERFKECLVSSVKDLSVTTMILAFSGIFSYGVVFDQLPATLTNILITVTSNKYLLILLIRALRKYLRGGEARREKAETRRTLGEVLKAHRMRCQMTQEFVAESLGVSRQAVSKWESGTADPSTSNLLALAKLFGVSAEELLKSVE